MEPTKPHRLPWSAGARGASWAVLDADRNVVADGMTMDAALQIVRAVKQALPGPTLAVDNTDAQPVDRFRITFSVAITGSFTHAVTARDGDEAYRLGVAFAATCEGQRLAREALANHPISQLSVGQVTPIGSAIAAA